MSIRINKCQNIVPAFVHRYFIRNIVL